MPEAEQRLVQKAVGPQDRGQGIEPHDVARQQRRHDHDEDARPPGLEPIGDRIGDREAHHHHGAGHRERAGQRLEENLHVERAAEQPRVVLQREGAGDGKKARLPETVGDQQAERGDQQDREIDHQGNDAGRRHAPEPRARRQPGRTRFHTGAGAGRGGHGHAALNSSQALTQSWNGTSAPPSSTVTPGTSGAPFRTSALDW